MDLLNTVLCFFKPIIQKYVGQNIGRDHVVYVRSHLIGPYSDHKKSRISIMCYMAFAAEKAL